MRRLTVFSLALLTVAAFAFPAFAEDCCPSGAAPKAGAPVAAAAKDPHAGMDMGAGETTRKIHEGKKDGYAFAFDIMPMKGEGITHHLMLFVKEPAGKALTGAKVGFDVGSPGKGQKAQRVMAMGMGDGYGANLDFSAKGKYTIKAKVVGGGKDLLYSFDYEVK